MFINTEPALAGAVMSGNPGARRDRHDGRLRRLDREAQPPQLTDHRGSDPRPRAGGEAGPNPALSGREPRGKRVQLCHEEDHREDEHPVCLHRQSEPCADSSPDLHAIPELLQRGVPRQFAAAGPHHNWEISLQARSKHFPFSDGI